MDYKNLKNLVEVGSGAFGVVFRAGDSSLKICGELTRDRVEQADRGSEAGEDGTHIGDTDARFPG